MSAIRCRSGVRDSPGQVTALRTSSDVKQFAFSTVDISATYTALRDINDAGDISGNFIDAAGIRHGFVLRRGEWAATAVDFPCAAWTRVWGINLQGDVVGTYGHGPGGATDIAVHGFLMSRDGQFGEIRYPGHLYEIPQRITSTGLIVGCYHDTDSGTQCTRSPGLATVCSRGYLLPIRCTAEARLMV